MTIAWSPHARALQDDVLGQIRAALSAEDALRWYNRIEAAVAQLADFPDLGTAIPLVCFHTVPPNADRLRQIICKPYRIVYEPVDGEIHILSIRHARMLIAEGDTDWS
jgi:plasmid stabilization system protein ParE